MLAAIVAGAGYFAYHESLHRADDELMLRIWGMAFIVFLGGYNLYWLFDEQGPVIMDEGNLFMVGSLFFALIGAVAGIAALLVSFNNASKRKQANTDSS